MFETEVEIVKLLELKWLKEVTKMRKKLVLMSVVCMLLLGAISAILVQAQQAGKGDLHGKVIGVLEIKKSQEITDALSKLTPTQKEN